MKLVQIMRELRMVEQVVVLMYVITNKLSKLMAHASLVWEALNQIIRKGVVFSQVSKS